MEEVPRGKALDRPRDVPGHPSHRLLGNFAYSDLAGLLCVFFREQQEAKQLGWAEGGDALSAPGLGRSWDVGEE